MKYHVVETTDPHAFEKIEQMLSQIPGAVQFAMRNVTKDARKHVMAEVYREIPKVYAIKERVLRSRKHNQKAKLRPVQYSPGQFVNADLQIIGSNISLAKFLGNTNLDSRKDTLAWVRKGWVGKKTGTWDLYHPSYPARAHQFLATPATPLAHGKQGAFFANVDKGHSGTDHAGIWERVGNPRDQSNYTGNGTHAGNGSQIIKEHMGTALPKMAGNDKVFENVGGDWEEYVDNRAGHYISFILANGVPTR